MIDENTQRLTAIQVRLDTVADAQRRAEIHPILSGVVRDAEQAVQTHALEDVPWLVNRVKALEGKLARIDRMAVQARAETCADLRGWMLDQIRRLAREADESGCAAAPEGNAETVMRP